jgi:phytoene desaturase
VVESLADIAARNGVYLRYNAPVRRIRVEGDRATGVVLESGEELSADVVVANADLPYVYQCLLPPSAEARRLDRLAYTCSALTFYWGVDRVCAPLGAHNVFLAGDYRASFDRIFRDHTLPDAPSFYVHAPARIDPAAAPAGHDTLMVLVPVSHLDDRRPQDWPALRDRARAAVLARLAALGLPDLADHLKFEVCYTPRDWQQRFNLARGSAFSLSHTFTQVGYLRPHNQHARYRNLFFAGGSTHPGTGLPIVLISARLTTERILKSLA